MKDLNYLSIDDYDMKELSSLMTMILNACNRHTPIEASVVLLAVVGKILVDVKEAPNFDEFADYILADFVKHINLIKDNK